MGPTVMLWAALTLFFFRLLRMGEAVAPSDSAFDPWVHVNSTTTPSWIEVLIE